MTKGAKSRGQEGDRLDSWKEIAAYLGKNVRTALRWAKDGGMPVYHHAGHKRGAVYAYRSELDAWIHADRPTASRTFRKRLFPWAGAALGLAVAAFGVFLWLSRAPEEVPIPVGERSWVLFSDFDNQSGETRFDGTVETALRRELARSQHVLVVAPERVRDTLNLMKLPPDTVVGSELGRQICLRYEPVCVLLAGRVDRFGAHYLFSMEVVDPAEGRIVASSEEAAEDEDDILPAIQRLGVWLRNHMGEELAQVVLEGNQFEQVTTPSLRALERYTHGERAYRQGRPDEAEGFFRQAVAADPGFASAHHMLYYSISARNYGKPLPEEARDALQRAMELAETASEQERLFIEGTYYKVIELDLEKACVTNKVLAELFPDHYWASGNAALVCGGVLGHREDSIRFMVQTADQGRWNLSAATALSLTGGDFDRARPYIEQAWNDAATQTGRGLGNSLSFLELFAAEEYLDGGLLLDVLGELERIEIELESMEYDVRSRIARRLIRFHLALGQFQKAREFSQDYFFPGLLEGWLAYLTGELASIQKHLEEFRTAFIKFEPDPEMRLLHLAIWGFPLYTEGFVLDILGPLYEPEDSVALASDTSIWNSYLLATPRHEAKLQLIRGYQSLQLGDLEEAMILLQGSVRWFRENGIWDSFSYYFLGAELLAIALSQSGEPGEAYQVLAAAAEQRIMVNSYTTPLYHKLRARQARLARDLGRFPEAEAIEAELAQALALADPDHPILRQLRE